MASLTAEASTIANPLATAEQLEVSSSQLDGVPAGLENSVRFGGAKLTQAAGVLLRLPQDVIAKAIVIFTRFWVGPEGGSLYHHSAEDISAASIYIVTKLSAYPTSLRSIVYVYQYLLNRSSSNPGGSVEEIRPTDLDTLYLDAELLRIRRQFLLESELDILRTLGFQTHVALPYTLCINYLQTLDISRQKNEKAKEVASRAFAHLNSALLSPQLLFLTHQPPQLAVAAIYLAAREVGVVLPEGEWWELFDTDREELGFLVVALLSIEGFAREERVKWEGKKVPMWRNELREMIPDPSSPSTPSA